MKFFSFHPLQRKGTFQKICVVHVPTTLVLSGMCEKTLTTTFTPSSGLQCQCRVYSFMLNKWFKCILIIYLYFPGGFSGLSFFLFLWFMCSTFPGHTVSKYKINRVRSAGPASYLAIEGGWIFASFRTCQYCWIMTLWKCFVLLVLSIRTPVGNKLDYCCTYFCLYGKVGQMNLGIV